jgi:UDPglucose 6-dehydrogenase
MSGRKNKVAVWGCGYLGTTHATAMAELGVTEVVGIEVDPERLRSLQAGRVPFHEPGLPELLTKHLSSGRLTFSDDPTTAVDATVHFICVGTPQEENTGRCDLRYVEAAVGAVTAVLTPGAIVVGKSTVPVGTAALLEPRIRAAGGTLLWNPEFLREGTAVSDSLRPDRLVIGFSAGNDAAVAALEDLYRPAIEHGTAIVRCDPTTAELVKIAANTFLALKISYVNGLSELCDATGADVSKLAEALGLDERIGKRFLQAGIGFGGGCLPKDIRAFGARAEELGVGNLAELVTIVDRLNLRARERAVAAVLAALTDIDVAAEDATVCVLGAAFKPDSDDIRDSSALAVVRGLQAAGVTVRVVDPVVASVPGLVLERDALRGAEGADVVVLTTEWAVFKEIDPVALGARMRHRLAVDGRNAWDRSRWTSAGFHYRGLGRR